MRVCSHAVSVVWSSRGLRGSITVARAAEYFVTNAPASGQGVKKHPSLLQSVSDFPFFFSGSIYLNILTCKVVLVVFCVFAFVVL
jgi:hypothetical protein